MRKLALLLLISILCSGCVAFFNFPASRFDTPEAQGGLGKFRAEFGGGGSHEVSVTRDYQRVLADPQHPEIRADADSRFAIGAGLVDRLDLDFKFSAAEGRPYFFQLKYQLAGEPRSSQSSNNFSVAVTGAIGGLTSNSSNTSSTGGPSDYDLSGTALDTALILGRRVARNGMFYGGVFYTAVNYSGSQLPELGTRSYFSGRGYQFGVNFGLEVGFDIFKIKTEFTEVRAVSGDSGKTSPFLGLTGVFYF